MFQERYELWIKDRYFDLETRRELIAIQVDQAEIEDRFYRDLEFGTGGLRGVLGAGTNRMNKYVVRKVTQGLADYIKDFGEEGTSRGVVIAYDSRLFSPEFALETALVLAANGIRAYLFDALRPTPELSFAVRYLGAMAGVVITASHNPKEYNGYKVYWEDGGQIPPDKADSILAKINARESWSVLPYSQERALAEGRLEIIGVEVDRAYLSKVKGLALYHADQAATEQLSIIYSPLHGAGNLLVNQALLDFGYKDVFTVPEQELPDPNFSTIAYPNPEIPSTFDLARYYGEKQGADLLLATDPDADRLGVCVRDQDGSYVQLTGNQVGILLEYYLLSRKKDAGLLTEKATVIKTIASTDLADDLAKSFGVNIETVLTGFKFIAAKEKEMENGGWGKFEFGFEESNGYLAGDFVRDKDAVIAAVLCCEAALFFKQVQKRSLLDVLADIYDKYGYYMDDQVSITLKGKQGQEQITQLMDALRELRLHEIGGLEIERVDDYDQSLGRLIATGKTYALTLPRSNVLRFSLRGGGFVMARPSWTEPKIKFYFSVKGEKHDCARRLEQVTADFLNLVHLSLEQGE